MNFMMTRWSRPLTLLLAVAVALAAAPAAAQQQPSGHTRAAESRALDRPPVTKVEALRDAAILALVSDGNTLWAGASGGRLVRIDKADLSLDDRTERFRLPREDSVTGLFVDGDVLWVATNHNTWLAKPFRRTGEPLDPRTAGGFLKRWLSTHDDLGRRCGKSSLMTFLDEREFAWLGYFKGSAYRYEKRTGRCTEVFRPPSIEEWATALAADAGFVYIGTRGAGLLVVGRDALTAVPLTGAHHPLLARNQVIESLAVDDERVWLGTAKGLVAIRKSWLAQRVSGP
jgi:ligand-binding sensor domain-containing protein